MKKKLFLMATAILAGAATLFAQDTIPALTIDSTLTVRDSAIFEGMRVNGDATMRGGFTVDENALFRSDVTIEGNLFYPNAASYSGDLEDMQFLVKNPQTGQVEKSGLSAIESHFYSKQCSAVNGIVQNPFWHSEPNVLSVACPEVRVKIGTTEPTTHMLHVAGDGIFQGPLQMAIAGVGGEPSTFSRFRVTNTNYGAAIEANNTGNDYEFQKLIFLQFDDPSTEIFKVVNTETGHMPLFMQGNGTLIIHNGTRETFKLYEDGLLNVRQATVDPLGVWPDYVFAPDYDLRSLEEVKVFVAENGHLPNMPPAAQIEANGINIAENAQALTKTVEEMYLYILQLEARIAELEKAKP